MNKRLIVLCLSFGAIIGYGYALGGLGGYLMGQGKPVIIAAGLIGGSACVVAALKLWRAYLDELSDQTWEKDPLSFDHDGADEDYESD